MDVDTSTAVPGAAAASNALDAGGAGFERVCHPACFACRPASEGGLGLCFSPIEGAGDGVPGHTGGDGAADVVEGGAVGGCGVEARFFCDARYEGYPHRLHGGIIATLLDAAMTHCLFAQRVRAVTAKLDIRYQAAVATGMEALVRARIEESRGVLYRLSAGIVQQGAVVATARATFIVPPSV